MNYNKLKYFYEIAKIRNFSHASEILFVSQSSLSKAISDLEQDLDVSLFTRTNRNLILTEAGEELFRRVSPLFSSEEELRRAVYDAGHRDAVREPVTLNIGFMNFGAVSRLPLLAKDYTNNHPFVSVKTARYNKQQLFSELRKDHLDAGFFIYTADEIPSGFQYRQFAEYHIAVIMRHDHPLAGRSPLLLNELKDEPFIMHGTPESSKEYHYVLSWCSRNNLKPRIAASYEYVETVLSMVQSGLGIALLSDAVSVRDWNELVCVPVENAAVLYGGVFYKDKKKTPELEAFLNLILSQNQS